MKKTSLKAFHSLTEESKQSIRLKIINALKRMKNGGNFEQVAQKTGLKPDQCWKRLSELEQAGIVYVKGTSKTSSGREAAIRKLYKKYAA